MKGLVSFHPVDLELFDGLIAELIGGGKINPEAFLDQAVLYRHNGWYAARISTALREIMDGAAPPEADPGAGLWGNLKARLERIDYRPDPVTRRVIEIVEPDLHLEGRPFFITEGSADRVATLVDEYLAAGTDDEVEALALEQLVRLDRELARQVTPIDGPELTPDFNYRRDLLDELRVLFDLPRAVRQGHSWRPPDRPQQPASHALVEELPWRAVRVHARARPCWIARDMDGLETVCRAAGVDPPDVLVPAWRLLGLACDEFPELRGGFAVEMDSDRGVGAFVAPNDLGELQAFLGSHGTHIIREASRHGEGPACSVLLRKIRECATYAESRGHGYLEASGIAPPYLVTDGTRSTEPSG